MSNSDPWKTSKEYILAMYKRATKVGAREREAGIWFLFFFILDKLSVAGN
jgi:hypothetical protein